MEIPAIGCSEKYICPVCGGSHWVLKIEKVPDYGEIEVATPCPKCSKNQRETDNTGIPLQYAEADLPSFDFDVYGIEMDDFKKMVWDFFENWKSWEDKGMGLYLCSQTPGSGKTLLACSIARSVSLKYDVKIRFITAVDYLEAVGNSYRREQGSPDASAIYRQCELLVLDDLGAQKAGEWQGQEVFRLINERISAGKVTVITSNCPQDELNLDARTVDRIIRCTFPLALPEISVRRKIAEEKQAEVMKEIFGEADGKKITAQRPKR